MYFQDGKNTPCLHDENIYTYWLGTAYSNIFILSRAGLRKHKNDIHLKVVLQSFLYLAADDKNWTS